MRSIAARQHPIGCDREVGATPLQGLSLLRRVRQFTTVTWIWSPHWFIAPAIIAIHRRVAKLDPVFIIIIEIGHSPPDTGPGLCRAPSYTHANPR